MYIKLLFVRLQNVVSYDEETWKGNRSSHIIEIKILQWAFGPSRFDHVRNDHMWRSSLLLESEQEGVWREDLNSVKGRFESVQSTDGRLKCEQNVARYASIPLYHVQQDVERAWERGGLIIIYIEYLIQRVLFRHRHDDSLPQTLRISPPHSRKYI